MNDADLSIALRRHSEAVANNQPPQLNAYDLATLASAAGELRAIRQRIAALGPRRMEDIWQAAMWHRGTPSCFGRSVDEERLGNMLFDLFAVLEPPQWLEPPQ